MILPPAPLACLPGLLHPLGVRAAGDGDAGFLARLYASTRPDLGSKTADPLFVAALIAMQQRLQAAAYRADFPNASYLLLERMGAPCGRIVVDAGAQALRLVALRLVDIALCPAARGQGVGSHVVRALQQCAAHAGLPLTLAVHRGNLRARRLYLALGFESAGGNDVAEQMVYLSKKCT